MKLRHLLPLALGVLVAACMQQVAPTAPAPTAPPATAEPVAASGSPAAAFQKGGCFACHVIPGAPTSGTRGPDL